MKMKKISAVTMKDAMELARRELGENAVLIDSKKAASGGGLIVTFAIEEDDHLLLDDAPLPQSVPNYADILPFTPEIPKPATAKVELAHPAYQILHEALEYHRLPAPLREKLTQHIERQSLVPDALIDVAETALAKALTALLPFKPIALAEDTAPARALMLVGPHGAGKTATIAKLATTLTLQKKPVVIISTDTERMGGVDALSTLGSLLKCEVVVSDSRAHLKNLVAKLSGKAWVLVDSAGANIYEFSALKVLGEFASLQGVEPVLTCPAGMDREEAEEMAAVFQFLTIERMIITRLDATRRLSSVFAALTAGGYALANFTNSASPTDACQPFSAAALARLMLRQARERLTH